MKTLLAIFFALSALAAFAGEKGGNNGPGKELSKAYRIYKDSSACPGDRDLLEKACVQADTFESETGFWVVPHQSEELWINSEELEDFRRSCCGIFRRL